MGVAAKLRVTGANIDGKEFTLGDEVVLGRSKGCDLRIPSPLVSRQHARITHGEGRYVIEDLGAPNGTWLNGVRVECAELSDGDRIALGDCELTFMADGDAAGESTPVESAEINPTVLSTVDLRLETVNVAELSAPGGIARLKQHLEVLREVAEASCGAMDIRGLVERILDLLLRVYPQAEYAHALLSGVGGQEGELHLAAAAEGTEQPDRGMSRTLFDTATRERKAILAADAQADERFSISQSIVGQALRSMMCSPLVVGERILGGIQVSTTGRGAPFNAEDLQLLATVAGQAAVAAENTRLHSEMVAKERLAAVGQTVSSLAHCIKNVINCLRGGAYILDLGLKNEDREKVAKGWDMVKRNNDFMFDLVKDMLAYCRKSPLRPQPTDVGKLLWDIVLMIDESAAQKDVETSLVLADDLPEVQVDPTGMKRAVLNLLTNAVEACSEGSTVSVLAAADGASGALRITVEDDGPGMPDDVKEHLFEPFFTTKGSRGTGLGLALVQKMAQEHGGSVEVDSEVGRGTAFHISIPLANNAAHNRQV